MLAVGVIRASREDSDEDEERMLILKVVITTEAMIRRGKMLALRLIRTMAEN